MFPGKFCGKFTSKVLSFWLNKLLLIFCRLRIMLWGRTWLWPRLRSGLDPFWDMIQTNFFFFSFFQPCLCLMLPEEIRVQSALTRVVQQPQAGLHLIDLYPLPAHGRLPEACRGAESLHGSWKTSCCFSRTFKCRTASRTPGVFLVPQEWDKAWDR